MSDKVILKNITKSPKKMVVLNLDIRVSSERIKRVITVKCKDGNIRKKPQNISVPGSLRIPSGAESQPLPRRVLNCDSVQRAIKSRQIKVIEV